MEKKLKHFSYDFREKTNLGKLYLLPKINKRLYNVGRGPILIST